jgi:hypothetical protein
MEVVPEGAQVVARDDDGLPAVLVNRVGAGAVAYSIAVPEAAILPDAADAAARGAGSAGTPACWRSSPPAERRRR